METGRESIIKKAQALSIVKAVLGEHFTQHKQALLNELFALEVTEAFGTLNDLLQSGFLDVSELSHWTSELLKPKAPTSVSSSTQASSTVSQPEKTTEATSTARLVITADTALDRVKSVASVTSQMEGDAAALFSLLDSMSIDTVDKLLALEEKDRKFNVLDDLMDATSRVTFASLCKSLKAYAPELQQREIAELQVSQKRVMDTISRKQAVAQFHQLWSEFGSVLFLPSVSKKVFYYSVFEENFQQSGAAREEKLVEKREHLIFLLDISSSMNHDARGSYQAPKSADHPDSSIKKARGLIPPLLVGSIKKGVHVTLVLWNSKVLPPIEFTPDDFMADKETGELMTDEQMLEEAAKRTNDTVFQASGATNVEISFMYLQKKLPLLQESCHTVTLWFLTDGEETRYVQNAQSVPIPMNQQDPQYGFFNAKRPDGLTEYQMKMARMMEDAYQSSGDRKCALVFHWCHFGEAHPLFLNKLREVTEGHFHAVADIDKLKMEMTSQAMAPVVKCALISPAGQVIPIQAAKDENVFCARGEISEEIFLDCVKTKNITIQGPRGAQTLLDSHSAHTLDATIKANIEIILELEPALVSLIEELATDITPKKLTKVSKSLLGLKTKRAEALGGIRNLVKYAYLLQGFVEKILESVQLQIEALYRMLEQYLASSSQAYDTKQATTIDFFNERERMAIGAGLESMKVRLGSGMVTKCMENQIQRMVATKGANARKMLQRKCFVAETENYDDETTSLTLFIMEDRVIEGIRNRLLRDLTKDPDATVNNRIVSFEEDMKHNEKGVLISNITLTLEDKSGAQTVLNHTVPTFEFYDNRVGDYTCRPKTADLDGAKERYVDCLSFANFLELIRESNTLPASLYTISPTQHPAILFNSKELLYVLGGGKEMISFSYFRLYWRLSDKDEKDNTILVPGCFHRANNCLPLSPDPLTSLVFSSLMTGLVSEPITGTPLAPLTEMGNIYIGYMMMHLRGPRITSGDVARVGELLSSLACWIENPKTLPKKEDVVTWVDTMLKEKSISSQDSSARTLPIKAYAYLMLDARYPMHERLEVLQLETLRRYSKPLLGKTKGLTVGKNMTQEMVDNCVALKEYLFDLLADLGPLFPPSLYCKEHLDFPGNEDVPFLQIAAAEALQKAMATEDVLPVWLRDEKIFKVIVYTLNNVLNVIGNKCYADYMRWSNAQRLLYVWYALASQSLGDVVAEYTAYREPAAFQKQAEEALQVVNAEQHVFLVNPLFSWVSAKDGIHSFNTVTITGDGICLCDVGRVTKVKIDPTDDSVATNVVLSKIWDMFKELFAKWNWTNRLGNVLGMSEIDWAIVKALKTQNPQDLVVLDQPQKSIFTASSQWRNQLYAKWAPPKPVVISLSEGVTVAKPKAREINEEKKRISIIMIGNVDAGKSTCCGQIISSCGFLDPHVMHEFEREADRLGKISFKFAFVMDRLKQEREQGLTIEVSSWNVESDNFEVDILDAPGHRRFYKNMAVGASLADVAVLVVSAVPGEFEAGFAIDGMTREEALCAFTVGVKQFIVAVNKMDSMYVNYSQERFENIAQEVTAFLKRTGISPDKVACVPISAYLNENVTNESDKMPWFKGFQFKFKDGTVKSGITLMNAIDSIEVPNRATSDPVRIPILKFHKIKGVGTVAVGRVATGTVKPGMTVNLMPLGAEVKVKTIEIYHTARNEAIPGDLIAFNITNPQNTNFDDLCRGMVAVDSKFPLSAVTQFTARIVVLRHPNPLKPGFGAYCYCHTSSFPIKIVEFLDRVDTSNKSIEKNPQTIKKGDHAIVTIEADWKVCVDTYTNCPPLGRFALTESNSILGVGMILSTKPYAPVVSQKPSVIAPKSTTSSQVNTNSRAPPKGGPTKKSGKK